MTLEMTLAGNVCGGHFRGFSVRDQRSGSHDATIYILHRLGNLRSRRESTSLEEVCDELIDAVIVGGVRRTVNSAAE